MAFKPLKTDENIKIHLILTAEHIDDENDVIIGRFTASPKKPKKDKKKQK